MKKEAILYENILNQTSLDIIGRDQVKLAVEHSDIRANGKVIPFSSIPLFINREDENFFSEILKTVQGILDKMTRKYIEDPEYRKLFNFSKEMEKLICLPCHYETIIPVGRYDLFIDPDEPKNFWFCEFNTDGTSGMSRDHFIVNELLEMKSMQIFQETTSACAFPVIERMTEGLIEIYRSDKNAVEHPNIVITDFLEEGVMSDFNRFIDCFESKGIISRFVDVRDLVFDGEKLMDKNDGMVIHGIYRRLVTSVLLERQAECRALIDAVAAEKVVLMGHFRTALAHSKVVDIVMGHPKTAAFLTDQENAFVKAHIPATYFFNDEMPCDILSDAKDNQNEYILKPEEGFAAHGVYAGVDFDSNTWQDLLSQKMNQHYLLQRFISPGKMTLLSSEENETSEWPVMIGLYQAGGSLAGFYCRAGKEGVIDYKHGGILLPVVRCESLENS